jgi:hypothetical protein
MTTTQEAEGHFRKAASLFPPARLPTILYSEFLHRHPDVAKAVGREGWRPSDKVGQPAALIAKNCDPFQLLD